MSVTDYILLFASLITAVGVIIGAVKKIIKPITKALNDLDEVKKHTKENYLTGLRLTIMSENMPLEERLIAGDEYVKLGGNGQVKAYYHKLQAEYDRNLEVM